MVYPSESYFKNSGNIMSEHVRHQNIGVISVTLSQTKWNIFDNIQIVLKKKQSSIENIHLKIFFVFSSCLWTKTCK